MNTDKVTDFHAVEEIAKLKQKLIKQRDREFWDRAYCAVLVGIASTRMHNPPNPKDIAYAGRVLADAMLEERTKRWEDSGEK